MRRGVLCAWGEVLLIPAERWFGAGPSAGGGPKPSYPGGQESACAL